MTLLEFVRRHSSVFQLRLTYDARARQWRAELTYVQWPWVMGRSPEHALEALAAELSGRTILGISVPQLTKEEDR